MFIQTYHIPITADFAMKRADQDVRIEFLSRKQYRGAIFSQ